MSIDNNLSWCSFTLPVADDSDAEVDSITSAHLPLLEPIDLKSEDAPMAELIRAFGKLYISEVSRGYSIRPTTAGSALDGSVSAVSLSILGRSSTESPKDPIEFEERAKTPTPILFQERLELEEDFGCERILEANHLETIINFAPDSLKDLKELLRSLSESCPPEIQQNILDPLYDAVVQETLTKLEKLKSILSESGVKILAPGAIQNSIIQSARKILKEINQIPLNLSGPAPSYPVREFGFIDKFGKVSFQNGYYNQVHRYLNYEKELTEQVAKRDAAYRQVPADEVNAEFEAEFEEFYAANHEEIARDLECAANHEEIARDLECKDVLEKLIEEVEAPHVPLEQAQLAMYYIVEGVFDHIEETISGTSTL